jgi:hypothetical protein
MSEVMFYLERQERVPDEETPASKPGLESRVFRWRMATFFATLIAIIELILLINGHR